MGSNYQEEVSINWCEEVDHEEQGNDDAGIGRWYECVFCKRGFNTAQALGGHMNIHRRDNKASRNKPTSTNSIRQEENQFGGPRFQYQIPPSAYSDQAANHHVLHHQNQPSLSLSTYFPASCSSTRPLMSRSHFPDILDQQQPEKRTSLSLEYTRTPVEDMEKKSQVITSQKEELDLELRLGYDS